MFKMKSVGSNQFELRTNTGIVFYSYETPVAFFDALRGYFKTEEKFSRTTSKHVNNWCPSNAVVLNSEEFSKRVEAILTSRYSEAS